MRGQKSVSCVFVFIWCVGSVELDPLDRDTLEEVGRRSDYRTIPHLELLNGSDVFVSEDAGYFGQLLLDPARSQVVAGGRDALVRLKLDDLQKLESAAWPAPPSSVASCLVKGQPESDCRNYVKVPPGDS
jgi:hypothetical protein